MKESPPAPKAVSEGEGLSHTRLLQEELLARIVDRVLVAPGAVELQVERAHLLAELSRPREAAHIYKEATKARAPRYPVTSRAYSVLPFSGKSLPIRVLLLVAPEWGNAPFRKYLDGQTFLTLQVVTDFHDAGVSLPPHQLAINCISDADACRTSLEAAAALLAQSNAPCINLPAQILTTTREAGAERLSAIPGVRAPRIATFSREQLVSDNATELLANRGFSFPLLVRAPGYHTGQHFVRLETAQELSAALSGFPGDQFSIIEFLDARSADGQIRKYRVMMIGGKLYPAHKAISTDWKVHFFSSTTPDVPEHAAEDREFVEDMERVLGARVVEALHRIQDALKLDYAGIDFSIGANGEVLVYEANATMNVQPPEANEKLAYCLAPVQRIAEAVRNLFLAKALVRPEMPNATPAQVLVEFTLKVIEEALVREPERVDLKIERARLLIQMERFADAKDIYLEILTKDPTQFVALNNLGTLLRVMGYHSAALKVHREVAAYIPDNVKARVNLANGLREVGELAEARANYEAVLRKEPDHVEAHKGLAHVLMYQRETEAAWAHHRRALVLQPEGVLFIDKKIDLPRVLVFSTPCGGNSPITRLLEKKIFQTTYITPDFYDPAQPVPPHDLVLNAIGDADHCGTSLDAVAPLLERVTAPVLNRPEHIRLTGRVDNARMLGVLEDVVTPRIEMFSREVLAGPDGVAAVEKLGSTFPLLLRTPGFHEGAHFERVERVDDLAKIAGALPGQRLLAIQYLDAREDDGKIRKYRAMSIGGKLYPLHKAVSQKWMIHYYSAEMATSAAHRAEDAAYLEDMPAVLGSKAMNALERIFETLQLDYAGADFSLGPNGEVLLFEANATMAVPMPEKGELWDFRRKPVQRIITAVHEMLLARATGSK